MPRFAANLSMMYTELPFLERFGAELVLTPAIEGMTGAVFAAQELCKKHSEYFMPQQFENAANPEVHYRTTAREILEARLLRRIAAESTAKRRANGAAAGFDETTGKGYPFPCRRVLVLPSVGRSHKAPKGVF